MVIFHSFVTLLPFLGLRAAQGCFHVIQQNDGNASFVASHVLENGITCSLQCAIPVISKNDLDVSVDFLKRHVAITGTLIDPTTDKTEYIQQSWLVDSSVNLVELTMGFQDGNLTVTIPKKGPEKSTNAKKSKMRGALGHVSLETGLQHNTHAEKTRWAVRSAPFQPHPNAIAAARFTEFRSLEENFEHWNHMK